MTAKVVFRPRAEKDLLDIYHHIASENRTAAIAMVRGIRLLCASLSEFPERGSPRDDFSPGVRILVYEKRVTIAYRLHRANIQILRMFYAGRNTPSAFRE